MRIGFTRQEERFDAAAGIIRERLRLY